jgi:hypothetical protein
MLQRGIGRAATLAALHHRAVTPLQVLDSSKTAENRGYLRLKTANWL